jgi:TPP-dependent pyruvate/acetoin dehydrogenase alpha subunit
MLNNKKNIALGFLGDGAAEEGAFYESINLACLYKLPVIFVIEDNNYSVGIHSVYRKSPFYNHKNIFGSGIGALYSKVDGQDFLEVYNTTKLLRKRILMEKRPAIIHAKVLRRFVHSGPYSDLDTKERNEKLADHLKKDPIQNLKNYFIKMGVSVNFINKVISKKTDQVNKIFFDTIKKIKKK